MAISTLKYLAPEPARQMGYCMYSLYKAEAWSMENEQFAASAKTLAVASFRIALAALAFVALRKYHYNPAPTSVVGAMISIPATLLGWGSQLLCDGARTVYQNVIAKSFKEAGKGLGIFTIGYLMLEYHNLEQIRDRFSGVGDSALTQILKIDY